MTYDAQEISNHGAMPVALYEFQFGTQSWFYTNDEKEILFNGDTYLPFNISDSGVNQSGNVEDNDLTINLPSSLQVAIILNGQPPSETIWVQILRMNKGQTDAKIDFVGYVYSAKRVKVIETELTCKMLSAGFRRSGLRLSWTRGCPHALYDASCTVDKSLFAVTFEIDTLIGNRVGSSALALYPSGRFSNGFFTWNRYAGALERRAIEIHEDDHFFILGTSVGLTVDSWITVYPGCNRTTDHCKNKFNNLPNYGGIRHMPGKSPFQGDPVF